MLLTLGFTVAAVPAVAWQRGLYATLAPSFALRLGVFAAVAAALFMACRLLGRRCWLASILVVAGGLAFTYFVGVSNALALALLVCSALALGTGTLGLPGPAPQPLAQVLLLGLAVMIGVVGWLLPFPLHYRWVYLALAVALCGWRRQQVVRQLGAAFAHWKTLERETPGWLLLVVITASIAGMGLWLPSLNYDDNAAHLLLPAQLLREAYYHLDVSTQAWALAPWANNVLAAIAAMLAGAEARPVVAALWLLLGVNGAWRLAKALGGNDVVALSAAAVYASQPLLAYFTTTMQVDGASAAVLLQLAALLAGNSKVLPSAALTGAVLGLLAGLKISNGVFVLPALAWLGVGVWRQRQWRWLLRVVLVAALLAGASYCYATWITGNPVFPLFNGWFKSPFFPPEDLVDRRWMQQGLHGSSLWDLTFETTRFGEVYRGAFGLALLALLPALLLEAVRQPRSRAIALWFAASGLLLFLQIQYVRYLFPAIGPLLVVAVVGAGRRLPGWAHGGLIGLVVVSNVLLLPTTSWLLQDDPWRALFAQGPAGAAVLEQQKVPERTLLRHIFEQTPQACVLMTDPAAPFAASAGGRALVGKWNYDPRTAGMVAWADADASGQRWRTALAATGVSHVMVAGNDQAALTSALRARGFVPIDAIGEAEVWAMPEQRQRRCTGKVQRARDQARQLFGTGDKP
ncbi:MAG: hypothetical protein KGL91_07825 [Xanthomonadaceae bacterium]|nr:hypothetical protein [Xanthomonadaceae bacterium]